MLLPSKQKRLFRNYERALFFSDEYPRSHRLYSFYLLLRPVIEWLKPEIMDLGLEPDEAESELYIMAGRLFKKFDKKLSSIVPYLEKRIPWESANLLKSVKKTQMYEVPSGLIDRPEEAYTLVEEFYWTIPEIILEDRWVGKCFTRAMRYVIFTILVSDDNNLSVQELARTLGIHRHTMKKKLDEIKEILAEEYK